MPPKETYGSYYMKQPESTSCNGEPSMVPSIRDPLPADIIRWRPAARCGPRPDEPRDRWALVIGREETGRAIAAVWRGPPVALYRWSLLWCDGEYESIVCAADNWERIEDVNVG